MKTKKLKYTPDFDFYLLGISSTENDYKISWLVSNMLNSEFSRCDDLTITDPKIGEEQKFSVFQNVTRIEEFNIKLVSNKGTVGYLIPELKNIDYFMIILGKDEKSFTDELSSKLKKLENISAVFKLDPQSLKSKEKLLF